MPAVARIGDMLTTNGHGPSPAISSGSGNVFANFIPVARADGTDDTTGHPDKFGQTGFPPVKLDTGSSNVFVNNKAVARIGDPTFIHSDSDYGHNNSHKDDPHVDNISQGSTNVFANGA